MNPGYLCPESRQKPVYVGALFPVAEICQRQLFAEIIAAGQPGPEAMFSECPDSLAAFAVAQRQGSVEPLPEQFKRMVIGALCFAMPETAVDEIVWKGGDAERFHVDVHPCGIIYS